MSKLLTLLFATASLAGALAIATTCPVRPDLSGLDHAAVDDSRTWADALTSTFARKAPR